MIGTNLRSHAVDGKGLRASQVEAQAELLGVLEHGIVDSGVAENAVKAGRSATNRQQVHAISAR